MQNNWAATPTPTLEKASTPGAIRLLVLDIDGTISGDSNQVNPVVLEAIQALQTKGIGVAIATGRMYRSALRFHQLVGSQLPLICYQGALIQDPQTQQVHRHWSVPPALAQALLDYFDQLPCRREIAVHLYIDDQLYVGEMNTLTVDYAQRSQIIPHVVPDLAAIAQRSPTKVLALSDNPNIITQLLSDLSQTFSPEQLYLTRSVPTFFEATHPLVNKGTAVRYLAEEILGLDASQVMAIGDNWNDLEMLDYAGFGVAMGDAPTAVQNVANWVAPNVEADGVAAAIAGFLL